MAESLSIIRLNRDKTFAYIKPSNIAYISTLMANPILACLEKALNPLLEWSLITPPIPICLGLPIEHPSNLTLLNLLEGVTSLSLPPSKWWSSKHSLNLALKYAMEHLQKAWWLRPIRNRKRKMSLKWHQLISTYLRKSLYSSPTKETKSEINQPPAKEFSLLEGFQSP